MCAALAFCNSSRAVVYQFGLFKAHESIGVTFACIFSIVFSKLRAVDLKALEYLNRGELTNNLTNDIHRIYNSIVTGRQVINSPLIILIYLGSIGYFLGVFMLVGVAVCGLFVFILVCVSRIIANLVLRKLKLNDRRNKELVFMLEGVQNVKLNSWEAIIKQRIRDLRLREKALLLRLQFLRAFNDILTFGLPSMGSFCCIITHNSFRATLDLETSFFVITVFNLLVGPLKLFYFSVSSAFESIKSVRRIETILKLPRQSPDSAQGLIVPRNPHRPPKPGSLSERGLSIEFRDAHLEYHNPQFERQITAKIEQVTGAETSKGSSKKKAEFSVHSINLEVARGDLVMIVGKVGSGKSSLLKSVLDMLHVSAGYVQSHGTIAYVPQESFLINDRVRENIVFGLEMDPERYQAAIELTELRADLDVLSGGEFTEIGEHGVNLSGGQKQRISLARACYSDSDIYLIDDALSALDYHVGKAIFDNLVRGRLQKNGKTVLMVTHLLQYLPEADYILYMENGQISARGSYEQLIRSHSGFARFVMEDRPQRPDRAPSLDPKARRIFDYDEQVYEEFPGSRRASRRDSATESRSRLAADSLHRDSVHAMVGSSKGIALPPDPLPGLGGPRPSEEQRTGRGKLTQAEKKEKGRLKFEIITLYFREGNCCVLLCVLVFLALTVLMKAATDYWVGAWTSDVFGFAQSRYVWIYSVLIVIFFLFGTIRAIFWASFCTEVSISTFEKLLDKIMDKPMRFFNVTPAGQLLSLMGKDTDVVDNYVPDAATILATMMGLFLFTLIFTVATNVILVVFIVPLMVALFVLIRVYLTLNQELKRLEMQAYSPIISGILEVYDGLSQFRSYANLDSREAGFESNVDYLVSTFLHQKFANNCIMVFANLTMDALILVSYVFILLSFVFAWPFVPRDLTFLSVSLSWILNIPNFILFFAFFYTEYIQMMASFERILLNVDPAVREGPTQTPNPRRGSFGRIGSIEVHNVRCRYRDNLPLVLDGLSFSVQPRQKVALVGRTGSGKSSLLLALTRILNVENNEHFPRLAKLQKIESRLDQYDFPDAATGRPKHSIPVENSASQFLTRVESSNLVEQ